VTSRCAKAKSMGIFLQAEGGDALKIAPHASAV